MIPVNEPLIGQAEIDNVLDCLKTGWISSAGKYIEQFETAWAAECGVKHGVAVTNGTTALELACYAIELKPGDEVIMPSFTIISCAAAVVRTGAVPVLVDIEPRTGALDIAQVASRITSKTRAIMPVHMYGHPVDMDPVVALARKHDLFVLEDAAEVHGAEYLSGRDSAAPVWKRCGGLGDLATFSFFANKLITTGEGGMVVTNDDKLAERLRSLRNLCFRPPRRFYHTELGFNARMTNIQAAIGLAQIQRLPEIVARKRAIASRYSARLASIKNFTLPVEEKWARSVFWIYGILLADELNYDAQVLADRLKAEGVETRPYFLGMHEQPVFHNLGLFEGSEGKFPVSERWARRGLYLPAGLGTTDEQIDAVCDAVERVVNG